MKKRSIKIPFLFLLIITTFYGQAKAQTPTPIEVITKTNEQIINLANLTIHYQIETIHGITTEQELQIIGTLEKKLHDCQRLLKKIEAADMPAYTSISRGFRDYIEVNLDIFDIETERQRIKYGHKRSIEEQLLRLEKLEKLEQKERNIVKFIQKQQTELAELFQLNISFEPINPIRAQKIKQMNEAIYFSRQMSLIYLALYDNINRFGEGLNNQKIELTIQTLNTLKKDIALFIDKIKAIKPRNKQEQILKKELSAAVQMTHAFSKKTMPALISFLHKEKNNKVNNQDIKIYNEHLKNYKEKLNTQWQTFLDAQDLFLKKSISKKQILTNI